MAEDRIKNAVSWGVGLLMEFLPGVPGLYFPLLHSICVWAGRRIFTVRKELLSVEVWLGPDAVRTKSDGFVLSFFRNDPRLASAYAAEIARGDTAALRRDFAALYPVLGLGDVFLGDLFRTELARGDLRAVAADFRDRVKKAMDALAPAAGRGEFGRSLDSLAARLCSLGVHLLDDDDIRDLVLDAIEARIKKSD